MKKKMRIPLMFLITIMLAGLASAATFVAPTDNAQLSVPSYEMNVSVTMFNVENCTVTGTSASTGDTLTVNLYNQTVYTGAGNVNGTLDVSAESDASDWILTGTCYNTSGTAESITSITGVDFDNTAPTCTLSSGQSSSTAYLPTATWTVTCTSATGATIAFGGNTYDMTESSDVCSFSTRIPEGLYDVQITTSDGLNTTSCTELTEVNIRYDDNAQFASAAAAGAAGKKTATLSIEQEAIKKRNTTLGIIAVIGLVLWYRNKKK